MDHQLYALILPGSMSPRQGASSDEVVQTGLRRRFAETADSLLQKFRDALVQYHVDYDVKGIHVAGKELAKRLHMVESFCSLDHLKGLVAFIPPDETSAPFEAVDRPMAARQRCCLFAHKIKIALRAANHIVC